MAAALASWAGGQNPAYRPPPAGRDPRPCLGSDGQRACGPVRHANGVPRAAKAGAADFPERARGTARRRVRSATPGCCRRTSVLPRRLCRPRHGLSTIHRTLHARLRFRPETRVSGRCIKYALAARAEDHLGVALDLVEELGRDAHAAALADTVAH